MTSTPPAAEGADVPVVLSVLTEDEVRLLGEAFGGSRPSELLTSRVQRILSARLAAAEREAADAHEKGYWIGYREGKDEAETRDLNYDALTDERDDLRREAAEKDERQSEPFVTISTAIDTASPHEVGSEVQMWRRVTKVCEESGEVWRALSGYLAENPRKGQTHTLDDLRGELLDTASAALCAWLHVNGNEGDPITALVEHVTGTADRLRAALSPADPTTDESGTP